MSGNTGHELYGPDKERWCYRCGQRFDRDESPAEVPCISALGTTPAKPGAEVSQPSPASDPGNLFELTRKLHALAIQAQALDTPDELAKLADDLQQVAAEMNACFGVGPVKIFRLVEANREAWGREKARQLASEGGVVQDPITVKVAEAAPERVVVSHGTPAAVRIIDADGREARMQLTAFVHMVAAKVWDAPYPPRDWYSGRPTIADLLNGRSGG